MSAPPRKQCKTCPWRVGADPFAIPNGYSVALHRGLKNTIAEPGALRPSDPLRFMACHYSTPAAERACVGWLAQQLGPGNNLALRLRVLAGTVDSNVETEGPQHKRFEDTLPRVRRRASRKVLA